MRGRVIIPRVMKTLISIVEKITVWVGYFAAWLIVPLVLITAYEVFARYALGAPTIWAYELGTYLTGSYFILGCAYALKEDAHVRIDVFYDRFPEKVKAAVMVFSYLVLFLPLGWWMSYSLFEYAKEAFDYNEHSGLSAWNPVIWPFRFIVFAGFVVLSLQASAELLKFLCILFGFSHLKEKPHQAPEI